MDLVSRGSCREIQYIIFLKSHKNDIIIIMIIEYHHDTEDLTDLCCDVEIDQNRTITIDVPPCGPYLYDCQ